MDAKGFKSHEKLFNRAFHSISQRKAFNRSINQPEQKKNNEDFVKSLMLKIRYQCKTNSISRVGRGKKTNSLVEEKTNEWVWEKPRKRGRESEGGSKSQNSFQCFSWMNTYSVTMHANCQIQWNEMKEIVLYYTEKSACFVCDGDSKSTNIENETFSDAFFLSLSLSHAYKSFGVHVFMCVFFLFTRFSSNRQLCKLEIALLLINFTRDDS